MTAVTSSGTTTAALASDLGDVAAGMVTAGRTLRNPVLLMSPQTSLAIGLQTARSQPAIPAHHREPAVPATQIILVDEAEMLLADEGGIEIERERGSLGHVGPAPVQGSTAYTGLWQNNLAGIRAERFISWAPARSAAATAGDVNGFGG